MAVVAIGLFFYFIFMKKTAHDTPTVKKSVRHLEQRDIANIPAGPKVAIVIDDMGGDTGALEEIISYGLPVSIAVLPFLNHSEDIARKAEINGIEVLLHLPMEPVDLARNDPGYGALFTDMSGEEITAQTEVDISAVPGIVGVNNHMGSRFSSDLGAMKHVMEVIGRRKGLFFLDSMTSAGSVGYKLAREMKIRAAKRRVFLDNVQEVESVKSRILELIDIAEKNGSAIAIGHPHGATIVAIREMLPEMRTQGIQFVTVSSLAE